jgi:hypothetical protein
MATEEPRVTTSSLAAVSNRHASPLALAATLAVVSLCLAFSAAPAAALTTTPYDVNLVKNPGFEAGYATTGYSWIAVPNWQTYGNMTVVRYGAAGFPSLAEGARIAGGNKFFTMGTPPNGSSACQAVALQSIPIRGRAAAIDAGMVDLDFRAYLGTYDAQTDTAVVIVRFEKYDYPSSEVSYSKTKTDSWMLRVGGTTRIPYRTRSITIYLASKNTQGYCDAYFDRISVVINPI